MSPTRPRTFRAPVVTVLLAFGGGCESEEPAEAAAISACSTSEPAIGAACEGMLSCGYGESMCGHTRHYRCEDGGIRRYVSTCNPPWLADAGDAGDASTTGAADAAASDAGPACPAQLPDEGAVCSGDLSCVYERGACGEAPVVAARCRNGAFTVLRTACLPRDALDGGADAARSDADSDG